MTSKLNENKNLNTEQYINEDEISLLEILANLWKRRWFIGIFNISLISIFIIIYNFWGDKISEKFSHPKIKLSINSFLMQKEAENNILSYLDDTKEVFNEQEIKPFSIKKVDKISSTKMQMILQKQKNVSRSTVIKKINELFTPIYKLEYFKQTLSSYNENIQKLENLKLTAMMSNPAKKINNYNGQTKLLYINRIIDETYSSISTSNFKNKQELEKAKNKISNIFIKNYKDPKTKSIRKDLETTKTDILNLFTSIGSNKNIISYDYSIEKRKNKTKLIVIVFILLSFFMSLFMVFLIEYWDNNKNEIKEIFKQN